MRNGRHIATPGPLACLCLPGPSWRPVGIAGAQAPGACNRSQINVAGAASSPRARIYRCCRIRAILRARALNSCRGHISIISSAAL